MTNAINTVNANVKTLYRFFTQDEYDLNCPMPFQQPESVALGTSYGALWTLFSNRADGLQNFANIELEGSDADVGYPFDSIFLDGEHWLTVPQGDAGMDWEDLTSSDVDFNASDAAFGIGFHILLDSLPTPGTYRWVLFTGDEDICMGFRINPDGRGEYVRKSAAESSSAFTGVMETGVWYSVYITYKQDRPADCILYVNGAAASSIGNLQIDTTASQVEADRHKLYAGRGLAYSFRAVPATWDTNSAPVKFSFSEDFLTASSDTTYNHASCAVNASLGASDKCYWEMVYNSGTYLWFGVCDEDADLSKSPALIGWCFAAHNGRRWDHQTGGGTNWKSAVAAGSVLGFAWDGPNGQLSVYVNGVLYGTLPYAITAAPVVPFFGADKESDVTLRVASDSWGFSPPDDSYIALPYNQQSYSGGEAPHYRGRLRLLRIRKGLPAAEEVAALADVEIIPRVYAKSSAGDVFPLDNRVYKWYADGNYIGVKTPGLATGFYSIYCTKHGEHHLLKRVNIKNFSDLLCIEAVTDDFKDPGKTMKLWDAAHKSWGGQNGGCSAHLLRIDADAGCVYARGYGDGYNGSHYFGVDRRGNSTARRTRVGACLVSKRYFTPGTFEFRVKFPPLPGACCAIWTFHYEESYPGDNLWQEILGDGIHRSGDAESGHYLVRNHEIDIETPSALKTDADQEASVFDNGRFNSWLGELRNWDVPNSDVPRSDPMYSATNDPAYWSEYTDCFLPWPNGAVNDGAVHDLKIDWNTSPEEISFYKDGTLVTTVTTHVPKIPMKVWFGIWFPSASTLWAGADASWQVQDFCLYRFAFTPHADAPYVLVPESYPSVGLRPLTMKLFEDFPPEA
ncbi:SPRY domain-containing protein [Cloacibacillus evryensis]|uniref:SPRY domain-containing protein n=1 Tax=Cloacibacillus evryensis TaxID=508460 RepID=UPI000240E116|nr:SPRY domain-containing protein [Cloacibacillus evryensis]EHL65469.1 hypothetical protein HMPREF1006_00482 [Synergistes sp. 3_1_syn1]